MIRRKRGLVAVGVGVLVVGLIVFFPARVATSWIASPDIAINGVSGTAWNGTAREASVGDIYLQDVTWKIRPLSLLTGKASYRVSARPVSGFVETDLSASLGGRIILSELQGAFPLYLLAGPAGVPGLEGNASLTFERVEIVDGLAAAADGTVQVAGLVIPVIGRQSLGGYKAEFFTQNNGVTASIEDTDGVVDLAGSLQIKADRSFEFVAQIVPKADTPQSIRQQLSLLPPPNARGQQEVRLEGIL